MARKLSIEEAQELLRRYRAGQCTKREVEIINQWYQSLDEDAADEEALIISGDLDTVKSRMLETINNRIDREETVTEIPYEGKSRVRKFHISSFDVIARIAAVLVLTTAVGLFIYKKGQNSNDQQGPTVSAADAGSAIPILKVSQAATLYLSDGSVVWLKEGSTLEYPETFSGNVRIVSLTGEAFFDVAKNPEKPFVIHASNFTTRVLGTTFNVKSNGDESGEVVVVTGKVIVSVKEPASDKVRELVLQPNRKAVYSGVDHSLVESPALENAKKVAVDKRKFAFEETSLENIINVLNAAHGTRITLSTQGMNKCIVTADLTNESLEVSLTILSKAINATYTMSGKNILLLGTPCGVQP
jgi:transmembrane sensor